MLALQKNCLNQLGGLVVINKYQNLPSQVAGKNNDSERLGSKESNLKYQLEKKLLQRAEIRYT